MRTKRARVPMLLAVFSVAAVVLAACAPAAEPVADEPPAGEPAADELAEDEHAADESAEDEHAESEPTEAEQDEVPEADAEEAETPSEEQPTEDLQITAYVVAYHWGFAIFDEDGGELEQLRAPKGATVELVAVNDHASAAIAQLPDPVAAAIDAADWHERAHHDVEMGRIPNPAEETGESLSEALAAAHDGHNHMGPVQDHSLMVTGVGARTFLDSHAQDPEHLVFTVEREGTFEFRCTEECGFGHDYQRWEMLVVEA